jgi:hypothetical protein
MEGKFDETLKLIWNGKGVEARGPLEWDDKDTGVSLHVAVMQDEVSAIGRTGDDVRPEADEFLVAAAVQGDGTLKKGPAIATGWALVHGERVEMYEWSVPVKLENSSASLAADLTPARGAGAPA